MRMFQRALARAGVPVAYSQGFNPHPRISLPLPRPVGMASDAELLLVRLAEPMEDQEALSRLAPQMPGGITLTHIQSVMPGQSFEPVAARYRLVPEQDPGPDLVQERIASISQSDVVPITRKDRKTARVRSLDLKDFLMEINATGNGAVEFWLKITQQGSIRPSEVAATLGFDADSINHRIRRLEVRWTARSTRKTTNTPT